MAELTDQHNDRWTSVFNVVIDSFDLREIDLSGRQFSWVNSLPNPTYEKLDRVLMMTDWEFKYSLVSVHALGVSDHTPLLLDTSMAAYMRQQKHYKMELSWFTRDDFYNRVLEIWNKPVQGSNSVQHWNNKMSALRRYLRGWAAHTNGTYKL
jgi:hypothetical protein